MYPSSEALDRLPYLVVSFWPWYLETRLFQSSVQFSGWSSMTLLWPACQSAFCTAVSCFTPTLQAHHSHRPRTTKCVGGVSLYRGDNFTLQDQSCNAQQVSLMSFPEAGWRHVLMSLWCYVSVCRWGFIIMIDSIAPASIWLCGMCTSSLCTSCAAMKEDLMVVTMVTYAL